MDCVFCDLIKGRGAVKTLKIWSDAFAIVPLNPVVDGHVLIIPFEHVSDALENPDVTASVMKHAAEFAKGSCNIITSVGSDATQSVFHLHVHIVPRHAGDGISLPWTNQNATQQARAVDCQPSQKSELV